VAGDLVVISVTAFASLRYGLAADAFVDAALRDDPAGERGRSPMGGAKAAASALATAAALDDVMRALQQYNADGSGEKGAADTARSLAGYFVLQAAEEERGWKPEAAGLSEREALAAARAFAAADADGDGAIAAPELRTLMCAARMHASACWLRVLRLLFCFSAVCAGRRRARRWRSRTRRRRCRPSVRVLRG
jgi:hypothetical protein